MSSLKELFIKTNIAFVSVLFLIIILMSSLKELFIKTNIAFEKTCTLIKIV